MASSETSSDGGTFDMSNLPPDIQSFLDLSDQTLQQQYLSSNLHPTRSGRVPHPSDQQTLIDTSIFDLYFNFPGEATYDEATDLDYNPEAEVQVDADFEASSPVKQNKGKERMDTEGDGEDGDVEEVPGEGLTFDWKGFESEFTDAEWDAVMNYEKSMVPLSLDLNSLTPTYVSPLPPPSLSPSGPGEPGESAPPPNKKRRLSLTQTTDKQQAPQLRFKQQFTQVVSPRNDTVPTITFTGKDKMRMVQDTTNEQARRSLQDQRRQAQLQTLKDDKDRMLSKLIGTSDPKKLHERFEALEVANGRLRARVEELEEEMREEKRWKTEVGRLWNQAKGKGPKEEQRMLKGIKEWMGRWFDEPTNQTRSSRPPQPTQANAVPTPSTSQQQQQMTTSTANVDNLVFIQSQPNPNNLKRKRPNITDSNSKDGLGVVVID